MRIPKLLILAALLCTFTNLFAQTVEVVLLQNRAAESDRSLAMSELIVGGGLEALFDAGFIATNSRPQLADLQDFLDYVPTPAIATAYVDYVFVIYVDYSPREGVLPSRLRYRLLRVSDGQEIKAGSVATIAPAGTAAAAIDQACLASGAAVIRSGVHGLN